jgi:tRNA G18 (ribose-2'-O)-methylase SpoU
MFTKRKFHAIPLPRQHKKCAEMLRTVYNNILADQDVEKLLEHYQELQTWMDDPFQLDFDLKQIADRYHYHLKNAQQKFLEHNLLPSIRQGDREKSAPAWPISIYLDGLRSAHNVGSIIRTVEAFALGSVYFSPKTPYIDQKQVQDASMGAFQWVQCSQEKKAHELTKPFIALETSTQATSIHDFIFPTAFTLALGNEEYGCSDEILKLADFILEIPLRGRKNSLNVANAFAIAASEIQRQKGKDYEKDSI